MWTVDLSRIGRRKTLLIGQLVVLLFCLLYAAYIYFFDIQPDKRARESFQQTSCFLISKRLTNKGNLIHQYRADFLISYNVNGVQYNRWVSGNGLDMALSDSQSEQEDILTQYDVGGTYNCWVSPENPQVAVLIMRHNWISIFPLMVPAVVALITLYYLGKNIVLLARGVRARLSPRRAKKPKKQKN